MSPTFQSAAATTSTSGTTTHVMNNPASIAAGDMLVIHVGIIDSANSINTPAGYTSYYDVVESAGTSRVRCQGFYKLSASGSEGATTTLTSASNSSEVAARIFRITGHHTTNPPTVSTASLTMRVPWPQTRRVIPRPPAHRIICGSRRRV